MSKQNKSGSVEEAEIKKFSALCSEWWNEEGKLWTLHSFNPIRIEYIKSEILNHFRIQNINPSKPLHGITILDVGCGGGIASEPLSRLGGEVTGIDASSKSIDAANEHANLTNLNIDYRTSSIEELSKLGKKFDVVMALEIIEHVASVEDFISHLSLCLNDGGIAFISTVNRSIKSLIFAKVAAEYLLNLVPHGTHSWSKFLKPSEISTIAEKSGLELSQLSGFSFNPFKKSWKKTDDLSINYIASFTKI